jgi:hypothetical protein
MIDLDVLLAENACYQGRENRLARSTRSNSAGNVGAWEPAISTAGRLRTRDAGRTGFDVSALEFVCFATSEYSAGKNVLQAEENKVRVGKEGGAVRVSNPTPY